jgi:hypothetical protein
MARIRICDMCGDRIDGVGNTDIQDFIDGEFGAIDIDLQYSAIAGSNEKKYRPPYKNICPDCYLQLDIAAVCAKRAAIEGISPKEAARRWLESI